MAADARRVHARWSRVTRLGRDERGSGDPLVLLHGVATSRLIWRRVSGPLARSRRVIAVDVPGFGDSPPVGPGFALDAVADRLVEDLGVDGPFDLLGHSLGGAVAVATAARHPEAVRRLVLVAPAGLAPRAVSVAAVLGKGAELSVRTRRALGYRFVEHAAARWAMFAGTIADPGALDPDDARLMLEASGRGRRIGDGVRQALEADLRDDFVAAPMPVGLIWGSADRVVPYAGIEALRRLRPDAAVATLARTGHIPQIEDPPGFAAAVERVLAALEPAHGPEWPARRTFLT